MNIKNLLGLIEAVEAQSDTCFDMKRWICGTVGCMVGSHMLFDRAFANKYGLRVPDGSTLSCNVERTYNYKAAAHVYGITEYEALYLFGPGGLAYHGFTDIHCDRNDERYSCFTMTRDQSRAACVARVRKFIAYKSFKAIMMADESYRRREGDHMVVTRSREAVAV